MVKRSWNLDPFIDWITGDFLPSVKVGPGAADYGRRPGTSRAALYGTADVACILYTLDRLGAANTREWVAALTRYQDPRSGFFIAETAALAKAHNTGFAVAAINLFEPDLHDGVSPLSRFNFADLIATTEEANDYIDVLDWRANCYAAGERLIGLASTFFNVDGVVPSNWFDWLVHAVEQTKWDAGTGMVGLDKPSTGDLDQIGGTFHFDFFWSSLGKVLPNHEARQKTLCDLQLESGLWDPNNPWWLTFDATYMLGRTLPLLHGGSARYVRAEHAIELAVNALFSRAGDSAHRADDFVNAYMGVHNLTGAILFFAYAQQVLGADRLRTSKPLKLVLDRRPYI